MWQDGGLGAQTRPSAWRYPRSALICARNSRSHTRHRREISAPSLDMAQNAVRARSQPSKQMLTSLQSDETLSLLTRLSQKPGVQSTLILSRDTGAIVRTSGLISNSSSANPNSTLPASEAAADGYTNGRKDSGIHSAEDVASMVWAFLKAAGSLVDKLDKEDEVKLLRLRTKKNELVIIPGMRCGLKIRCTFADGVVDPKYILIAIHDTPPA
jgi:dynein light chain roadblock-type